MTLKTLKTLKIKLAFCFLVFVSNPYTAQNVQQQNEKNAHWVGTWATAQQLVEPNNRPPAPELSNNTLRQIVRVSIGGNTIRIRFSNKYSASPLQIKAVSIAPALQKDEIAVNNAKNLQFSGKKEVSIPANADVYSDALDFPLQANSLVAITIHYGETPTDITGHPGSRTTSYLSTSGQENQPKLDHPVGTDHWYSIMGIEVIAKKNSAAVAIIGNSITDGRGSGTNKQNRWTDILSQRLLANKSTSNIGVLNLGIGGNCVVRGGLGPTALVRFDYDILSQQGVKWLIILEGINDIGGIRNEDQSAKVADDLIEAYKILIAKAHSKGIKVFGATILPFAKSFYDQPFRQVARTKVNEWIRSSGAFDAIIDFDHLMESNEAGVIRNNLHDNDFLHPNEAGYKTMGDFISLKLFTKK